MWVWAAWSIADLVQNHERMSDDCDSIHNGIRWALVQSSLLTWQLDGHWNMALFKKSRILNPRILGILPLEASPDFTSETLNPNPKTLSPKP